MVTTKLSKGGRLDLPRNLLDSHHWRAGTEFTIEDRPDGLLLRPLGSRSKTVKPGVAAQGSAGCDRALATAMRDRYARQGH